jgi:hypothetical protein
MRRLFRLGLIFAAGAVAGCADTPPSGPASFDAAAGSGGGGVTGDGSAGMGGAGGAGAAGIGGHPAAAGAGGSTGSAGAAGSPQLAPPAPAGLVALNSDGRATSLSILSTQGGVHQADCVDSASAGSGGSSQAISGDAVLPSQPQRGGDVVIVDRGNGALVFVNPGPCTIVRQVPIPGGASTDPTDVVILADAKAYVTRSRKNPAATDPTLGGNDVAVIDPSSGSMTGRIGFDDYASAVPGAIILARPDRAVIAGGKVAVSLNESDASSAAYGEGKVVVIDPATDQIVAGVALTGLYDCEGLTYVESTKTLLVSCGGAPGGQDEPLQSGVAVLDLGSSPPNLIRAISSVAFDDRPVRLSAVVALPPAGGGTRAFTVTNDPSAIEADALFAFDYVLGSATKVATSDPGSFGRAAGVPGLLFVPDSQLSTPQIELFDVSGTPQATTGFASDPVTGLPPREVAAY